MRAHHAWGPRGVSFQPRGWGKKNGEKTWNRTRRSTPAPPAARSHAAACLREASRAEEGESHQPDARRINAIIARRSGLAIYRYLARITWLPFNRPFHCSPAYPTCLVLHSLPYFPSFSFVSRVFTISCYAMFVE